MLSIDSIGWCSRVNEIWRSGIGLGGEQRGGKADRSNDHRRHRSTRKHRKRRDNSAGKRREGKGQREEEIRRGGEKEVGNTRKKLILFEGRTHISEGK